jgi:N-acetylmuramoyl-L-alanine amidase
MKPGEYVPRGLPQEQYVKAVQKLLGVYPSGNFEHETTKAVFDLWLKAYGKPPSPIPEPLPEPIPTTADNPFSVKDGFLYKDGVKVHQRISPNYGGNITPTVIVIHYTGDNSFEGAVDWLCKPSAKVSAHLVISKAGEVWQLVPFDLKAWHAGVSSFDGQANVNDFSIGIENVGTGDSWPAAQVEANRLVIEALVSAYDIEAVVGHDDVATPAGRKVDPGKNFPWTEVLKNIEE